MQLSSDASATTLDIGIESFNEIFNQCPVLRLVLNGAVFAIYKRLTCMPHALDPHTLFTSYWSDTYNTFNTDFKLYSSEDDAIADANAWTFCNFNDNDVGFPRDCGPSGSSSFKFFTFPGGTFTMTGITSGVSLDVFRGCTCPTTGVPSPPPVICKSLPMPHRRALVEHASLVWRMPSPKGEHVRTPGSLVHSLGLYPHPPPNRTLDKHCQIRLACPAFRAGLDLRWPMPGACVSNAVKRPGLQSLVTSFEGPTEASPRHSESSARLRSEEAR